MFTCLEHVIDAEYCCNYAMLWQLKIGYPKPLLWLQINLNVPWLLTAIRPANWLEMFSHLKESHETHQFR